MDKVCSYDAVRARYRNPKGKTGLRGRGMLGRYGPNHAADCIVTRFHPVTSKPQAIVVERVDGDKSSTAWPAGMVEPGEEVPEVLEREMKEAEAEPKRELAEADRLAWTFMLLEEDSDEALDSCTADTKVRWARTTTFILLVSQPGRSANCGPQCDGRGVPNKGRWARAWAWGP